MASHSIITVITITLIISILMKIMSSTKLQTTETNSPFECGFDPSSKSRKPFSLSFFLLAVLFLIFDVEIILILPAPYLLAFNPNMELQLSLMWFIILMIGGLMHEWNEGALFWK